MAVRSVHAPEPTALRERQDRLRRGRRDILLASGRHFRTSGLKVKGGYFSVSAGPPPPVAKPLLGLGVKQIAHGDTEAGVPATRTRPPCARLGVKRFGRIRSDFAGKEFTILCSERPSRLPRVRLASA